MINMMEVGKPSGCPVKAVKFKKKGKASRWVFKKVKFVEKRSRLVSLMLLLLAWPNLWWCSGPTGQVCRKKEKPYSSFMEKFCLQRKRGGFTTTKNLCTYSAKILFLSILFFLEEIVSVVARKCNQDLFFKKKYVYYTLCVEKCIILSYLPYFFIRFIIYCMIISTVWYGAALNAFHHHHT